MRTLPLGLAALAIAFLGQKPAAANSTGIAGYSGKAGTTCTSCHQGATVFLQAQLTGPTFLKPGATGSYTFLLGFYLQSQSAGLGVAAQAGALAVDPTEPATKLVAGELVHAQPKLASSGLLGYSWKFNWTAPNAAGSYTLYGAGVASNNNKLATGDANGKATFVVTVGSCQSNADCNDGNICTFDACVSGTCSNTKIANCCNIPADCDDGNACTNDACNALHQCTHTPMAGCCSADSQCSDGNVCTLDTCDLSTHKCQTAPIPECCTGLGSTQCNDGNKCTVDSCNLATNTCQHLVQTGCCTSDADCADTNPCTTDTCNVATGICLNTKKAGCCLSAADCNDKNGCTKDSCVANACVNTKVAGCCSADAECADTNPCTKDTCSNNTCTHTAIPGCSGGDGGPLPAKDGGPAHDGKPPAGDGTPPAGDGKPAADGGMTAGDGSKPGADGGSPGDAKPTGEGGWPSFPEAGGPAGDGSAPPAESGCCRVSGAGVEASAGLPALLLLGLLLGLARRRR